MMGVYCLTCGELLSENNETGYYGSCHASLMGSQQNLDAGQTSRRIATLVELYQRYLDEDGDPTIAAMQMGLGAGELAEVQRLHAERFGSDYS
jgi:hypothetical protein